jgi:predicted N-acetyltransferase YhbS
MISSLAPSRTSPPDFPTLAPERPQDARLVDGLIARAFGPGRYAKAAERLREHNAPLPDVSFAAWSEGRLAGCVRLWPVHVGPTPAVFLGPFAVEPEFRSLGLGAALIRKACAAAAEAGHRLVLLVGDAAYFEPLGFRKVPPGRIVLPGPVDPGRVLTLALAPGADADLAGPVSAG